MSKLSPGTSQDPFVAYADCILEGGTLAWRNNNPGNLLPGKLPYKNAIGIDKRGLAIFPDYYSGWTALHDVLRSNLYGSLSITDAMKKYAPASDPRNDPVAYAARIHQLTGLDTTRLVKSLSDDELQKMMGAIKQVEGFTVGTIHHPTDSNLTPQLRDFFGLTSSSDASTPSDTSGDSNTVAASGGPETSSATDSSDASDASDSSDSSDTSDSSDSSDTSGNSDSSSSPDNTDNTDGPETTDTTDNSDTSDTSDNSDTSDGSDTSDSADSADSSDDSGASATPEPELAGADS